LTDLIRQIKQTP